MYLNGEIRICQFVKTKLRSLYRQYKQFQSIYSPFVKLSRDATVKAWQQSGQILGS